MCQIEIDSPGSRYKRDVLNTVEGLSHEKRYHIEGLVGDVTTLKDSDEAYAKKSHNLFKQIAPELSGNGLEHKAW